MAKNYRVILTKVQIYEVNADDLNQATDIALQMNDSEKEIWTSEPIDEVTTEEVPYGRMEGGLIYEG